MNGKLHELTDEELAQVTGGVIPDFNEKQPEIEDFDINWMEGWSPKLSR